MTDHQKKKKKTILVPEIKAYMYAFSIIFQLCVFKMQHSILTFTNHFIWKYIAVLKFSVLCLLHYAFYLLTAEKMFNPMVPYSVI